MGSSIIFLSGSAAIVKGPPPALPPLVPPSMLGLGGTTTLTWQVTKG